MVNVPDMRPLYSPLALDDQVITLDPDGGFLGNQTGDFSPDDQVIFGFEDFNRRPPGGNAFLPLAHERLRDIESHFDVNR